MTRSIFVINSGIAGVVAAFFICLLGGEIASWIEQRWNIVVVSWEMAFLFVSIIAMVGGCIAGIVGSMTGNVILGGLIGGIGIGSVLIGISLTNGSPRGVAIWAVSVGVASGIAAGAYGGWRGK